MREVINLSRPLAEHYNVQINYAQEENVTSDPDIPAIPLRHIFLTLLNDAIPQASGKSLNISVSASEKDVVVDIVGLKHEERENEVLETSQKNLSIVQQIMEMFSGSLMKVNQPGYDALRLTFPIFEKIPVLIIDDNPDAILLLQRYTSNTRFSVSGVRDPSKAVHQAEIQSPKIILIDLMMPGVDGWEILNQIRESPLTSATPVVVVSILPQESLALTLGADAFMQKPISQNDFLNLLAQFFPENIRS
jgi:CheY-like chemotaxis protein